MQAPDQTLPRRTKTDSRLLICNHESQEMMDHHLQPSERKNNNNKKPGKVAKINFRAQCLKYLSPMCEGQFLSPELTKIQGRCGGLSAIPAS